MTVDNCTLYQCLITLIPAPLYFFVAMVNELENRPQNLIPVCSQIQTEIYETGVNILY